MRKLKKLTALALASTMVFSSFNAFAATPVENSGATLQQLSIISGDQNGDLNEDGTLTREESMVIALKLMGVTPEEDKVSTFSDDPANWASKWIGTAQDLGVTAGMGDGTFGYGAKLTARQAVAIILNTLGYEDTYNNASELGLEAGIVGAADVVALDGDAVRGDVFDMMYKALSAQTEAGEGEVLINKLVAAGAVTEDLAIELGLVEEEKEFAVEAIEALNLVQFQVSFTQPVDESSATDMDNYDADGIDLRKASAKLVEDNKVVITLDLTKNYDQQVEGTITVEKVKNAEEVEVPKFEEKIKLMDNTFPEVVDATIVGKDAINVVFSEPLNVSDYSNSKLNKAFELRDADDEKQYVDDVKFNATNTEAIVTFHMNGFEEEEYTLKVLPKYEDFAGFTYMSQEYTLDVAKDEEGPFVVETKDVKPNKLTLVFNEPLKSLPKAEKVWHTNSNSSNQAEKVAFGDSQAELVVTFKEDSMMPERAYVYVKAEAVKDMWDNDNDTTIKVDVEVPGDDEKPVLEKVAFGDDKKHLVLTFNEELNEDTATDRNNFELLDKDGEEMSVIRSASLDSKSKKITLELRKELASESYTLKVEDVEDYYGNEMEAVDYEFSLDDVDAPDFGSFDATLYEKDEDQTLVISFGEKMDASDDEESVLNLENYRVKMEKMKDDKDADDWNSSSAWNAAKFVTLSDIEDLDIETAGQGTRVEITINQRDGYRFVTGTDFIEMARVKDEAGNETAELAEFIDVDADTAVKLELDTPAEKFVIKDKTTATFVVNGTLVDLEEEEFDFKIDPTSGVDKDVNVKYLDIDYKPGAKTEVTIKLDDDMYYFSPDGDIVQIDDDGDEVRRGKLTMDMQSGAKETADSYGNVLEIATAVTAQDKYAPKSAKTDGKYVATVKAVDKLPVIEILFDEPLLAANAEEFGYDLTVELGDKKLKNSKDFHTDDSTGKKVVITVTNTDFESFDGDISVEVKDNEYIVDTAKNGVEVGETYFGDIEIVPVATVTGDDDADPTDDLAGVTKNISVVFDQLLTAAEKAAVEADLKSKLEGMEISDADTAAAVVTVTEDTSAETTTFAVALTFTDVDGAATVTLEEQEVELAKDLVEDENGYGNKATVIFTVES